jgi:uncharacterized membrane protein YtjA (UPF0391 family)
MGMASALPPRHTGCSYRLRRNPLGGSNTMLSWAAGFFVIALVAGVLGFAGIAASAAGVAKILFIVFLVFALISLLLGRRPV